MIWISRMYVYPSIHFHLLNFNCLSIESKLLGNILLLQLDLICKLINSNSLVCYTETSILLPALKFP